MKGMTMLDFIALSTAHQRELELQRRLERRRQELERTGVSAHAAAAHGVLGQWWARMRRRQQSLRGVVDGH